MHLVDLVSRSLPIPSVLFFSGLALWVVFSVLVRRSLALHGYDPLKLAGLSWDARSQIRYSISNRRLSDDSSVRALAIEWSNYEVVAGRRNIFLGVLSTLAVELILCVAYDFSTIPALLTGAAILQSVLLFLQIISTVVQIRRLPLCEQLARDREFESVPTTANENGLGDSS